MKRFALLASCSLILLPSLVLAQSVDLLWQGDTYTPPFYQGGALWTGESIINLVAIPQGLGSSANLVYRWNKNDTILGSLSGKGKNTLSFKDSIFSKPQTVKVEVLSASEEILAETSVNVSPEATSVLIYEKHPLYGFMFNTEASRGYKLDKSEVTFAAFPLFFSTQIRELPSLKYTWRSSAGEDSLLSSVTYRVPEGASGSVPISLSLSNSGTLRQTAERKFLIQFGNTNE